MSISIGDTTKFELGDVNIIVSMLPKKLQGYLLCQKNGQDITDIILDLGRKPIIRLIEDSLYLDQHSRVTEKDLKQIIGRVGTFKKNNRAGINGTLHRISAIRNSDGTILGVTIRVGRVVTGSANLIEDIIKSGKSILILGPPGVGKTTKLREVARILSVECNKRVMIVDTSNEIAGEGDVPLDAVGYARRMQVPMDSDQHEVMIEAVENHTPEVIIVDEIGTQLKSEAARTIAERGVQLVATAHGDTLENLIKNPTISDLVGGVQTVILGDTEAKYRESQKTILERKNLPTFDVVIELHARDWMAVYHDTKEAVDAYLNGEPIFPEIRRKDGKKGEEKDALPMQPIPESKVESNKIVVYSYGVHRNKINDAAQVVGALLEVTNDLSKADIILTTKSQMKGKGKAKLSQMTEGRRISIHVIGKNAVGEIKSFLISFCGISRSDDDIAMDSDREIMAICERVLKEQKAVDASPQSESVRRAQTQFVKDVGLSGMTVGKEPNRRLRVYPK